MLGPVEEPERPAPGEPPPPRRLAWSTAIFAAATGLSRIFGLVREIVARNYFGVRGPINAFEIAFLIPNTVRALVADAALSEAKPLKDREPSAVREGVEQADGAIGVGTGACGHDPTYQDVLICQGDVSPTPVFPSG